MVIWRLLWFHVHFTQNCGSACALLSPRKLPVSDRRLEILVDEHNISQTLTPRNSQRIHESQNGKVGVPKDVISQEKTQGCFPFCFVKKHAGGQASGGESVMMMMPALGPAADTMGTLRPKYDIYIRLQKTTSARR